MEIESITIQRLVPCRLFNALQSRFHCQCGLLDIIVNAIWCRAVKTNLLNCKISKQKKRKKKLSPPSLSINDVKETSEIRTKEDRGAIWTVFKNEWKIWKPFAELVLSCLGVSWVRLCSVAYAKKIRIWQYGIL